MLADYHVHSEFSDDSEYPIEKVVLDAIDKRIEELCFTDHVDYGIKVDFDDPKGIVYRKGGKGEPDMIPLTNVNYPEYYKRIVELKEKYKDKITIKLGLEFGIQKHTIDKYNDLFNRYPFDFIILSVHQQDDLETWNQDYQRGKTQKEYNEGYYNELLYCVKNFKNYSVLGHMDLIARYDLEGKYPFELLKPLITEILKEVIKDGKGIELNTSYHRYNIGDLTPSRDILRLYKDLGGRIITIGSDSHKLEHLGAYLEEGKEELRKLGFEEFCTFEKMKPIFHRL